jgi:(2S)-methylsuccinyl-CoA dehydrogenase
MPHDGQDIAMTDAVLLPDLIATTRAALPAVEDVLARARDSVSAAVMVDGRISAARLEANQTAAHGLAWLATYAEALRQMQRWAEKLDANGAFGETEALIHQIAFGEYLWQIYGGIPMSQGEIVRLQDLGLTQDDQRALMDPAVMTLTQNGNTQAARDRLVTLMRDSRANLTVGATGLDEEYEMIREQFRRFSADRVEPFAHEWHLRDELIPMEVIQVLLPVITQSSPSFTARVRSDPRSDPVFGSVKTAVGRISPLARPGSHLRFCSSVPPQRISSAAISDRVPSDPTPI